MASHVVVIDSAARRAVIKVIPSKPLSDVLEDACKKLGLTASQYGLKNNNKQVDLSRTIRLSGLSSGAKLELVQLSRSPSVVSVALQIPESEAHGQSSARLTDKFPSTTTLWLVLRKFEAGVAGGAGNSRNFTARSVPVTENGNSGAGGLYYQQPVIGIMGRELSTFTDLQKTLGQLGFNSGSTLLRLSFKTSETPMHEAVAQIEDHFRSIGESSTRPTPQTAASSDAVPTAEEKTSKPAVKQEPDPAEVSDGDNDTMMNDTEMTSKSALYPAISSRPIQVFSPPSASTPVAASTASPYNPTDYVPTVEHAQAHQRLLSQSSRNIRLPTDSELLAQAQATKEKLASITSVEIKIRFPDQSSIVSTFSQSDTGATLYNFVRECLSPPLAPETFLLKYPSTSGRSQSTVPDVTEPSSRLIQDLELKGRVLMTFSWHPEKAPPNVRTRKDVLKEELRESAREIEVVDVSKTMASTETEEDKGVKVDVGGGEEKKGGEGKKIPKWLKLPGKK